MTKTISLSDDAYELLRSLKRPGESFTDVTERLAKRARQEKILELAGQWTLGEDDAEEIKTRLYRTRDDSRGAPPDVPP